HDGAVDRSRVDRSDAPAAAGRPAAVRGLRPHQVVEHLRAVGAPGQALVGGRALAEQLLPAIIAEDVEGLGVIVMGVFVVADAAGAAATDGDGPLAVLEPLLAQIVLVFAGAEQAGDGGGSQRRAFAAHGGATAAAEAVDHATCRRR